MWQAVNNKSGVGEYFLGRYQINIVNIGNETKLIKFKVSNQHLTTMIKHLKHLHTNKIRFECSDSEMKKIKIRADR